MFDGQKNSSVVDLDIVACAIAYLNGERYQQSGRRDDDQKSRLDLAVKIAERKGRQQKSTQSHTDVAAACG
jgi:hypothetical protein